MGSDASLLEQHLHGQISTEESLRTATFFYLEGIPSVDDGLRNLVTLAFVTLHLFYPGGHHVAVIAEILLLIEILEELRINVHGMITYLHFSTTLLFDMSRRCSLYLKR